MEQTQVTLSTAATLMDRYGKKTPISAGSVTLADGTRLPYDRIDPDLAYTSISSMIRTLEMKGYVSHRRGEGKTHVYFPIIDSETAGESVLGRVLEKVYGGSPIKLLAHLMDQHRLSDKELTRMRNLLKRAPKRPKK